MDNNFSACLAFTLLQEGGWSDDPRDPGGPTNQGITLATLRGELGQDAAIDDLRNMTNELRDHIYLARYWWPILGQVLPIGLDLLVFDEAVNTGVKESSVILQMALNSLGAELLVDGAIGQHTKDALKDMLTAGDLRGLLSAVSAQQVKFYQSLVDFPTFGNDWIKRAEARLATAQKMLVTV